ncbi:hypothetical protein PILCRDRAFT_819850 [Piloderma croceum F 1598]|uniref:Uncharacterized protein n=1 Tax=Piloderma croceum (strain F 1598) TaxID=765440 RepID=A0A0C3FEY2_PILCF|nr:hypothetical protein PILCRDRAFT_819850 [Piloderma croceum F 1598]
MARGEVEMSISLTSYLLEKVLQMATTGMTRIIVGFIRTLRPKGSGFKTGACQIDPLESITVDVLTTASTFVSVCVSIKQGVFIVGVIDWDAYGRLRSVHGWKRFMSVLGKSGRPKRRAKRPLETSTVILPIFKIRRFRNWKD